MTLQSDDYFRPFLSANSLASTISRYPGASVHNGFSMKTFFPALTAARAADGSPAVRHQDKVHFVIDRLLIRIESDRLEHHIRGPFLLDVAERRRGAFLECIGDRHQRSADQESWPPTDSRPPLPSQPISAIFRVLSADTVRAAHDSSAVQAYSAATAECFKKSRLVDDV